MLRCSELKTIDTFNSKVSFDFKVALVELKLTHLRPNATSGLQTKAAPR